MRVEQDWDDLDIAAWGGQEWSEPTSPSGAAAAFAIVAFMAFVMGLGAASLLLR